MANCKVSCSCNAPSRAITVIPKVAFESKAKMSLTSIADRLREREPNYVLQAADPIVNVSVNVNVRDAVQQPTGDSEEPDKRRFLLLPQSGGQENAPPPATA